MHSVIGWPRRLDWYENTRNVAFNFFIYTFHWTRTVDKQRKRCFRMPCYSLKTKRKTRRIDAPAASCRNLSFILTKPHRRNRSAHPFSLHTTRRITCAAAGIPRIPKQEEAISRISACIIVLVYTEAIAATIRVCIPIRNDSLRIESLLARSRPEVVIARSFSLYS